MDQEKISTTQLAKLNSVDTKEMFRLLCEKGLLKRNDRDDGWDLTELGIRLGGEITSSEIRENYPVWPKDLDIINFKDSRPLPQILREPSTNSAESEGERYIREFFKGLRLKFEQQVPIKDLKHDEKDLRVADFYLPQFNVYLEFLGNWNSGKNHREQYELKKYIYRINRIPCIFIYPDNLGYLHFSFDHRMLETLKENRRDNDRRKYNLWKFRQATFANFFGIGALTLLLIILYINHSEGKVLVYAGLFYNVSKIMWRYVQICEKETYSLQKIYLDGDL